ncbi:MAG: flagellar basal body P-ring formation chaperone FlgA [Planctomycetota bacterium]
MNRLLTIAVLLAAAPGWSAELTLLDVAEPRDSIVRLGDIATIAADSDAEAQRLADLPLGVAPAPLASQFLRPQAVRELLEALGESPDEHRFIGAKSVEVRGPQAPPQPFAVERANPYEPRWRPKPDAKPRTNVAARPAARESIGFRRQPAARWQSAGLSGRQLRTLSQSLVAVANQAILAAGFPATVRVSDVPISGLTDDDLRDLTGAAATLVDPSSVRPGADATVRFRNGSVVRDLRVRVEESRMVVVSTRPLRRGELLTAANTQLVVEQDVEGRGVPADAFGMLSDVAGLEARGAIRAGQPLTPADCVGPIMVRRGEPVSVLSGVGRVTVRLRGIARAEGRVGDLVSVEVHDRQRVDARVTGPGELAIFGGRPSRQLIASSREGGLQ